MSEEDWEETKFEVRLEGQNHKFDFRDAKVKVPLCIYVDMLSKERGEVRA